MWRDIISRPPLRDGNGGGEDISALPEPAVRQTLEPVVVMRSAALMLLGLMALFALILTAWFLTGRLVHLVVDQSRKRRYLRADAAERAQLLEKWIYAALTDAGLDACLGWETAQTDARATEHFADVGAGEYTRVAVLMEKSVYGGETPEPFELRTLQAFLQKIFAEWKFRRRGQNFLQQEK